MNGNDVVELLLGHFAHRGVAGDPRARLPAVIVATVATKTISDFTALRQEMRANTGDARVPATL
jgi:hypothetical protein